MEGKIFTLAHEIYHLLYEDVDDFIVCGVNNNSQSEKNADNFVSTLLMPDSALYWFLKVKIKLKTGH